MQLQLMLTLAASFLAAPVPKDKSKDEQAIQGTWVIQSAERDGKPFNEIKGEKLTLKEGNAISTHKGKEEKATYKINATTKPRQIDFTPEKETKALHGIYELAGDSLKVCIAQPGTQRPGEFSGKGEGRLLIVLKRMKK